MTIFIVGVAAGVLTTAAFLPQLIRVVKTKHTKDLSLITFSLFSLGVSLWLIYGILLKELPIILANAFTLVFAILIVIMKIKYG
ncbi:MAG: SemiSWEET transporter [Candidatus Omnitrophota bacterium]|jgi:MtN3 and saliva related transmembrane protein